MGLREWMGVIDVVLLIALIIVVKGLSKVKHELSQLKDTEYKNYQRLIGKINRLREALSKKFGEPIKKEEKTESIVIVCPICNNRLKKDYYDGCLRYLCRCGYIAPASWKNPKGTVLMP